MRKGARKYETAKYRLFGGETYARRFHFATKAKANEYAKNRRGEGYQVRIIKEAGGYVTYLRDPSYAS